MARWILAWEGALIGDSDSRPNYYISCVGLVLVSTWHKLVLKLRLPWYCMIRICEQVQVNPLTVYWQWTVHTGIQYLRVIEYSSTRSHCTVKQVTRSKRAADTSFMNQVYDWHASSRHRARDNLTTGGSSTTTWRDARRST
jgi:hypothetical protein